MDLVTLFLESSKDRFINKLNLSDEDKQTLIDFCDKYPQYASKIDWNNKNLSMDDFKPVMELAARSKSALKAKAKNDPKTLFNKGKFIIYKETENWLYVLPMCWEDAKFMDSRACGGESARWCIGYERNDMHWRKYTSESDSQASSFCLAFNKKYNRQDFDHVPKIETSDGQLVPDANDAEYQQLSSSGKCQKYMIQILDDPETQTDVYGVDYNNLDHLVWTPDDEPENTLRLNECPFFELTDADISTIKNIFTKKFRYIDEDSINNMDPIECFTDTVVQTINNLPKNNENCPYKIILKGGVPSSFNVSKYIKLVLKDYDTLSLSTLKYLKNNPHINLDMDSVDMSLTTGLYSDYALIMSPDELEQALVHIKNLDYFYAFSEKSGINLTGRIFDNVEHARYTFFGCNCSVVDLKDANFAKLKSVERCFDNARIDVLDLRGITIPESTDLEDMFTNHKITTMLTDNQRIQAAFDEA